MSRWVELYATSPSGKALFICKMCGRQSPVPSKTCPTQPEVYQKLPLSCQVLEEIELAVIDDGGSEEVSKGLKFLYVSMHPKDEEEGNGKIAVQWRDKDNKWWTAAGFLQKENQNGSSRHGNDG